MASNIYGACIPAATPALLARGKPRGNLPSQLASTAWTPIRLSESSTSTRALSRAPIRPAALFNFLSGKTAEANKASVKWSDPPGKLVEVSTEADFDALLARAAVEDDRLVVLMLSTSWCGPCLHFLPTFESFAASYSSAVFAKCVGDVTESGPKLMTRLGAREVPAFRVFRGGKEVAPELRLAPGGNAGPALRAAIRGQLRKGEAGL